MISSSLRRTGPTREPAGTRRSRGLNGLGRYTADQRSVPPDRETLRTLAENSGGRYFEADDSLKLGEVYERLGSQVSTREEPREISGAVAGAATLLMLAGGGLSRLP